MHGPHYAEPSQNFDKEIDFHEIARRLGYTEARLRQLFRKEAKTTPLQYLIDFRLDRAKEHLESTDDPVNDILYRVGFSDPSYFNRSFKKKYNVSPSQYREKRKGIFG